jgi:hypothetical protein
MRSSIITMIIHVVRIENANNHITRRVLYPLGNANAGNFPNNSGGGIYCFIGHSNK